MSIRCPFRVVRPTDREVVAQFATLDDAIRYITRTGPDLRIQVRGHVVWRGASSERPKPELVSLATHMKTLCLPRVRAIPTLVPVPIAERPMFVAIAGGRR